MQRRYLFVFISQSQMGISPLHIAARKGNAAIVNLLIKNGATVQFQEVVCVQNLIIYWKFSLFISLACNV